MGGFHLVSDFQPRGDQPQAIAGLVAGLEKGDDNQVLLGVTGSGKTFTMAHVIAAVDRPALVIAHNKTLAAQLYGEFKALFPDNAVAYFVSYYDYYQPEAYIPSTDTYIEKDSAINEEIDKLRHAATHFLLERRDVIIVASVSCIYGLGSRSTTRGTISISTGAPSASGATSSRSFPHTRRRRRSVWSSSATRWRRFLSLIRSGGKNWKRSDGRRSTPAATL